MLSGVAIGEAAVAAGATNVSGSGAVVAESIAEPISGGDSVGSLAVLIGSVSEGIVADSSAGTPGAPTGEGVADGVELSTFFVIDGLWVIESTELSEWHVPPIDSDGWQRIAALGDFWVKQ
jgi:hypothetical protein